MTDLSPRLVGLVGYARAGKTTVADALVRNYGFVTLSFAGPLKAMMRTLYQCVDLDPDDIVVRLSGRCKEAADPVLCGQTPRHAMQTLGTEWGRNCIKDTFWTDIGLKAAKVHLANGRSGVFDDVRFQSEIDAIAALGGITIRIDRPGIKWRSTHSSEDLVDTRIAILNDLVSQECAADIAYILDDYAD